MEKLDKVIAGLTGCVVGNCSNCEYGGDGCHRDELMKDALEWLKEQNRLISELSDNIPCCDNCEGKTVFGERTDQCVYEIEGFDSVIYCAKRGIANCFGYRKKIEELEDKLKMAKDGRLELARQIQGWIEYFGGLQYYNNRWYNNNGDVVEVEPVVHAHWFENPDPQGWFDRIVYCSACKCGDSTVRSPRCRYCGAHMDEEVADV